MRLFVSQKATTPPSALLPPPQESDRQFHTQAATVDVYFGAQHTALDVARVELTVRCVTRIGDNTVDSTRFVFRREIPNLKDLTPAILKELEVIVSRETALNQKLISLSALERLITTPSAPDSKPPPGFTLERIGPQHPYDKLNARRNEPLAWSLASPLRIDDYLEGAINEVVYFRSRAETCVLYCRPILGEPTRSILTFEHGEPATVIDFSRYELSQTEVAAVLGNVGAYFRQGGSGRILQFLERDLTIVSRRKTPLGGTLAIERGPEPSTTGGVVVYVKGAASTARHPIGTSAIEFELSFAAGDGTNPIDHTGEFYKENATTAGGSLAGAPSQQVVSSFLEGLTIFTPEVTLVRADPAAFPSVVWNTVHQLRELAGKNQSDTVISFGLPPHLAQYLKVSDADLIEKYIGEKRFYFTVENLSANSDEVAAIIVEAVDESNISFEMIDRYGRTCKGRIVRSGVEPLTDCKADEILLILLRSYLDDPASVFKVCEEEGIVLDFPKKGVTVQSETFDNDLIGQCLLEFHQGKAELEGFRNAGSEVQKYDGNVFVPLNTIKSLGNRTYEARELLKVENHSIGVLIRQEGIELFVCVYDQKRNINLSQQGSIVSILASEADGLMYSLVKHLINISPDADLSKAIPAIVDEVFSPSTFPFFQNIGRFDDNGILKSLWWLFRIYSPVHSVGRRLL